MNTFNEELKAERTAMYETFSEARDAYEADPSEATFTKYVAARVRLRLFDQANGYL